LVTRRSGGKESVCRFTVDSITIQEKKTELTVGHFQENVKTLLQGMKESDVPPIFMQQCTIRCLAQPANSENALVLLADRLARVYGGVGPFGRPPSLFGVKFSFDPAVLEENADQDQRNFASYCTFSSPIPSYLESGPRLGGAAVL
jgi:hypothetical protein